MNASDLDRLRARFPSWFFTTVWTAAGSGPDKRLIVATRGGVVLSEWSEKAMADKIEMEAGR